MPTESMPAQTGIETAAHETLVDNLRNTHALEKQQIQVLGSHLELFAEYPDLHARVQEHITESREQARRLEAALEACGESASMFKDTLLSVMGLGQSAIQGFADDAVMKAVTADIMQEHLEIATYRALIVLAEMAGKPELRPRLVETLREEEAMAVWFDENLEAITRHVIEIKSERQANAETDEAEARDESPTADREGSETLWQQLENAKQSSAHPRGDQSPDRAPDTPSRTGSETTRPSETTAPGADESRPSDPANRT